VTSVKSCVEKCVGCGKHMKNAVSERCARCVNKSFSHLPDQLCVNDDVVVTLDNVPGVQDSKKKLLPGVEVVPIKQFVRGGKHGYYESFGVCMIDDSLCVDEKT
jgi:hypothetical protein